MLTQSKALGTDDAVTTCDCCGRSNLKFTVVIELPSGEVVHYGQVCATRNTGKTRPQLNAEMKSHHGEQRAAARRAFQAHPAYLAERARFAERDRLPVRLLGRVAADFVRAARDAADEACREVVARFAGVTYGEVRS
ncbi:hypothetical protein DBR42_18865 [Pelomonas sp. HMWF004]|nr:hypothetical protein DBR42_18865 [Pelomonas sp. HMWF004]